MPHKIKTPKKCLFFEAIKADAKLSMIGLGKWTWPIKLEVLNDTQSKI
jgi:hypothetical protein